VGRIKSNFLIVILYIMLQIQPTERSKQFTHKRST